MPRGRIFGIYMLLVIFALGAGMLIARFFAATAPVPSGYITPTREAILAATAVPESASVLTGLATPPPLTKTASPTAEKESNATPIPSAEPASATPKPIVASTAAPTELPTPASGGDHVEYTVQKGDTLKQIAEKYNVTVREILAINQIPNPDSLAVGSVVRIPKTQ